MKSLHESEHENSGAAPAEHEWNGLANTKCI